MCRGLRSKFAKTEWTSQLHVLTRTAFSLCCHVQGCASKAAGCSCPSVPCSEHAVKPRQVPRHATSRHVRWTAPARPRARIKFRCARNVERDAASNVVRLFARKNASEKRSVSRTVRSFKQPFANFRAGCSPAGSVLSPGRGRGFDSRNSPCAQPSCERASSKHTAPAPTQQAARANGSLV